MPAKDPDLKVSAKEKKKAKLESLIFHKLQNAIKVILDKTLCAFPILFVILCFADRTQREEEQGDERQREERQREEREEKKRGEAERGGTVSRGHPLLTVCNLLLLLQYTININNVQLLTVNHMLISKRCV